MIWQMLQAILLGAILVYLIMVAQFQSLNCHPFYYISLQFPFGSLQEDDRINNLLARLFQHGINGFMILMGTVVNNGIVFVDYTNKLRIQGLDKRTALIVTGKTRMRTNSYDSINNNSFNECYGYFHRMREMQCRRVWQ